MTEKTHPSISPEQLVADVGAIVREVPGVVDLHRNPLQVLGERVKLDWHGPVRFVGSDDAPLLEVHLVVVEGHRIPEVAEAARRVLEDFVDRVLPACRGVRLYVDDVVGADDRLDSSSDDGTADRAT